MIGQLVGHYRVLEKIGEGGMGEVFRARDERLGRDVALKLIRPAFSNSPDQRRRFEQEARAAAALNHPNIVAIYDVGFEGATPYIVCELLQGRILRDHLSAGSIPISNASDYALQIANGLTAAHERHIVHRDLKPENLFVTHDGRVKILDFGVAKQQPPTGDKRAIETLTTVTKAGTVVGTYAYMSPEQLRVKPVDHRSDIFSFGAILYEMFSGCRAFRGETDVDTMTAILREDPPEANFEHSATPAPYRDIVRHCLEKEPEKRFQSARDLAFALQTLSGGSSLKLASLRQKRWPALSWTVAAVLGLAVVLLTFAAFLRAPSPPPSYRRLTSDSGTVYSARFSPDGRSIVYSAAWNGKPVQLFTTVGDSLLTQPLNLTSASLLSISPKNELAVVVSGTHSGQLETIDGMLAFAPLAGGSPKEVLADVRWADWNQSGQLAVVHYVDGKSRLESPIGTVLYQSGGWISNIRFSPRGDQIAFMDHPAPYDNRGVVSVTDLSGQVRKLTPEWESESGLGWRRDGEEIWFTAVERGTNLNLMAVSLAGKLRTLLDLPVGLTLQDISVDGRVLISLNSKRLAMSFTSLGSNQDVDLSWHDWNSARDISSDGKFVLFEDASEAAGPNYAVVARNVDGTLPVQLGEGSAGGLSPDGRWAISISTSEAARITLLPIGAGQSRSLTVTGLQHLHNGWARFMPDGQRILVNGNEAGHTSRCYVVELSSGKATGVTAEGFQCGPSSPDGNSVLGRGSNRSWVIYSLNGAPPRPLPRTQTTFNPVQWSSDGRFFYGGHTGEFPSKVYKMEIATGKETVIQELKPGVPAGVVTVAPLVVSRDGRNFAYSYSQTLSTLFIASGLK